LLSDHNGGQPDSANPTLSNDYNVAGVESDRFVASPGLMEDDPYAQLEGVFGGYQADEPRPQGKVRDESLF
jgi:hypothetical protein